MARYIDVDILMEEIANIGGHSLCEWSTLGVKALIERQQIVIVTPKAEVAREIFEEMDEIMLPLLHEVSQVYIYAKLRKKYVEEKK